MSLATALYRELTGYDDPERLRASSVYLFRCCACLLSNLGTVEKSVLRVLGLTILVCVALVLLAL